MSRFGTITGGTANARSVVAQGADADSLGKALSAALLSSAGAGFTLPVLTAISLAGAGDGSQFFIEFEFGDAVNVIGGVGLADAKLVMASTAVDLQKQIAAQQSAAPLIDVQIAGAAKGRPVMALLLFGQVFGTQSDFLLSRADLSVNDAYVEGPYSQTPVLHAHSGGNVAGGFNGAGIGSKAILGLRNNGLDGLPLGQLKNFKYTWLDLSPPTSTGPFTGAYVNFIVDMLGDGTQLNIFAIDPLADASLVNNTTTVNPDGTSTTSFDAATQCPIIITPPAVVTAPAHTFGGRNSYLISAILADYPNAVLREADVATDGGSPKSPIKSSPFMIITGDSANNVVRAFQVKNVLVNGNLI